ncbi:MAG: ParB/Srx family N-terminal domain-containing protein [Flavobacteriales bacterium]|jgi:ParB-like chromosome segregation protein Spo0J
MADLKIEYRETEKLTPYVRNARTHSERQIQQIAASIQEFGFVNPILVNSQGVIVAGHGRLMAAMSLGMKQVPCVDIGYLSERQWKALMLADNRIALNAGWDFEKLAEELSDLAEADFDLELTGFDEQEIDSLLKDDQALLPDRFQSEMLPTERTGRDEPGKQEGDLVQMPRTTDDHHSTFELVMLHTNKVRLVEVLSAIKEEQNFSKVEEALMFLVEQYGAE